jgi:hypothetical protein
MREKQPRYRSRCSGWATGWKPAESEFYSRKGRNLFLLYRFYSDTRSRAVSSGYARPLSMRIKRLGHDSNHLSPFGAEIKNAWSDISILPMRPLLLVIKHWDNITYEMKVWEKCLILQYMRNLAILDVGRAVKLNFTARTVTFRRCSVGTTRNN